MENTNDESVDQLFGRWGFPSQDTENAEVEEHSRENGEEEDEGSGSKSTDSRSTDSSSCEDSDEEGESIEIALEEEGESNDTMLGSLLKTIGVHLNDAEAKKAAQKEEQDRIRRRIRARVSEILNVYVDTSEQPDPFARPIAVAE